jgi:hypothetical protein
MSRTSIRASKSKAVSLAALSIAVGCGAALAAQDRDSVRVPNGLSFSDFKGYEDWQTVAVSQATVDNEALIEVILGNPAMIAAYRAGFPDDGKKVPDGAKMAKIHWKAKKNLDLPNQATVPDALHDIDFMVKDSTRFANTGGWGYAQFNYDAASDTFSPLGTGAACGYACHTRVAAKDYVFTGYPKR